MYRLLYVSFTTFEPELEQYIDILKVSRKRNAASNISGVLLAAGRTYMQVLEGEKEMVMATFDRIRADRRHDNVTLLAAEIVDERLFPAWSMGFFHMTAIEDLVDYGLINNRETALRGVLSRHAAHDPIASTLLVYLDQNAELLKKTSAAHA